jgi:pimeloyl-ACP methyl ester carboxylesterase
LTCGKAAGILLEFMKSRFTASLALLAVSLLSAGFWNPSGARAANRYVPFDGEKTTWHDGFDRFDYLMDEESFAITPFKRPDNEEFAVGNPPKGQRRCIVVVPKQPAAGNPWSWQACYWDHEPQTEVELLRRGFHIAFITPDPAKPWDAWYDWLTEKHGLSKKPAFVGMSRGGLNEYDWTTMNPDKVSCIYADNPLIRPQALARLGELAKNDVALLNICGSADSLLQRNTLVIEGRYQQLGGCITVMIKDGQAHHPHSLRNPKPIADWIVDHMLPSTRARADFADEKFIKSYYYSLASTNLWLKEEETCANCRGPGFVECYDRYDERTSSPWGVTGLAVIAPKSVAPGKPWVFRADAITRDAVIDQGLLARGFHIAIPALTAQSGAVRTQWNNAYQLMTGHGFSKKPVMEGTGTAAGEAYAWASENPDKVACIVGRNPALRSLMSKISPLENLSPLAKAGVPLLHVCDKTDPWFNDQTKVVERRYKELGGEVTVIINENDPHYPLTAADQKRVVDFLVGRTK